MSTILAVATDAGSVPFRELNWPRKADEVDNGGFFDASIWESAKKNGDIALKRLINGGLQNTTVTVVLIGSHTYARRWVRYEIMKSIERGNAVFGVHVNSIRDKHGQVKAAGPNPFSYLGLHVSQDGCSGVLTEWNDSQWVSYADTGRIGIKQQPHEQRGRHLPLHTWFPTYDWIADNGFANFEKWVA